MSKIIGIILCLFIIFTFFNCVFAQNDKDIKATADKYLDNILQGLKENNYDKYIQNFSAELKNDLKKDDYAKIKDALAKQFGNYKSREYLGILRKGNTIIVIWKSSFDNTKDDILTRLYLIPKNNKYEITGLTFN